MKLDDLSKLKIKVYTTIAFIVITFYFAILRIDSLRAFIGDVTATLSPFIIGIVIAFLLDKNLKWRYISRQPERRLENQVK